MEPTSRLRAPNDPGVGLSVAARPDPKRNVRRAETDEGLRGGLTSAERERMKQLERENRELRRTNEILKAAASFFGAELDRRQRR